MPKKLGRYRLVRPISTGGMAQVYEAHRESLAGVAPRVAIKVILPEHAEDEAFRQLFVNEARIGSLLRHQNLVQIQDFNADQGLYYLVMEYVEGLTLRQVIRRSRRRGQLIPVSVIAEVGRQVCDGLHHAHSARSEDGRHLELVHRDLKPSNLMITPHGVVKLLDFGVSRALIAGERSGAVRGTWGYMAPEQAAGNPVTATADLFGLGAVLYEMASLQPLFTDRDPDTVKRFLAEDEGARLASRLSGTYDPLARVLIRCLQRDPVARFPTGAAMGRALGGMLGDPLVVREHLIHLYEGLNTKHKPDTNVSADAQSHEQPVVQGLPVRIGDAHRPRPPEPVKAAFTNGDHSGGGTSRLMAGLLGVAMAIVAYTGWIVIGPQLGDVDQAWDSITTWFATDSPEMIAVPDDDSPQGDQPIATQDVPPLNSPEEHVVSSVPVASGDSDDNPQVAPMGSPGWMTIGSVPRAEVTVDGEPMGSTPLFQHELQAGEHDVTLVTDTGMRTVFSITINANEEWRRIWSFPQGAWIDP